MQPLLIVAFSLLLPSVPMVQHIFQGTVHKGVNCRYRGDPAFCLFIEQDKKPYMFVTRKDGETLTLRYVVTLKDGKPLEVWSHDQREV